MDRVLHDLQEALQQVRKATEIISHLRTFGRSAPVSREPVAINHIVQRALMLMHEELRPRQIRVELELSPEDPIVMANAIQLEQVFVNLLANALDALTESPDKLIAITTRVVEDCVELRFRDTGPGIPPPMERRIFDPFFTTKEVGAGTGLGLSITYGIIKEHQGTISVENRPGEGATFVVQLPLAAPDEIKHEIRSTKSETNPKHPNSKVPNESCGFGF